MILILVKRPHILNTTHFSFQPAPLKLCVCMHVSVQTHTHSNAEPPKHLRGGREHGVKKVPYILNVITRWGQVVCFTQIRIPPAPLSTGEKAGRTPQPVPLHWPSIKFWILSRINLSSLPQLVT